MNIILQSLALKGLRLFDPETAHGLTIKALRAGLGPKAAPDDPRLACDFAGLSLPNPIGLAAGFDKNAAVPVAMLHAGFGFVECGTVTPKAQAGNPRPRLFRLIEDEAVINRYGFNNEGLTPFVTALKKAKGAGVIGANIGANKDSEDRVADYVLGLGAVWDHASYVTINISSPNTPGLRGLQTKAALEELLGAVGEARQKLADQYGQKPLFLKVAPDLASDEIEAIASAAVAAKLSAIIVSNTTISRPDYLKSANKNETGGLSGKPVFDIATRVLAEMADAVGGKMPLIGVGGITDGPSALAKFQAGAGAVQLYSALTWRGLGLIDEIKAAILANKVSL